METVCKGQYFFYQYRLLYYVWKGTVIFLWTELP